MSKLDHAESSRFVPEEMSYVRSRLLPSQYRDYLARKSLRAGEEAPLREAGRQLCLAAIDHWDAQLRQLHLTDYEHAAQLALALATGDAVSLQAFGTDNHDSEEAVLLSQQLSHRALVSSTARRTKYRICRRSRCPSSATFQPGVSRRTRPTLMGGVLAALAAQPKRFRRMHERTVLGGGWRKTIYRRGFSLPHSGYRGGNPQLRYEEELPKYSGGASGVVWPHRAL